MDRPTARASLVLALLAALGCFPPAYPRPAETRQLVHQIAGPGYERTLAFRVCNRERCWTEWVQQELNPNPVVRPILRTLTLRRPEPPPDQSTHVDASRP